MRVVVTVGFIIIVISSIFPVVGDYILWGFSALFVLFLFIASPRNPKP